MSKGHSRKGASHTGRVTVPPLIGMPLLATDGAGGGPRGALGWLCTDGQYGYASYPHPMSLVGEHRSAVNELRAIYQGLRHVPGPVRLITDCKAAIDYLEQWRAGRMVYPDGYTTWRPGASLVLLAELVHARGAALEVEWVPGHAGHPLNETADSLAKLAYRTPEWVSKDEAQRLAAGYVERTLAAYQRLPHATRRGA